MIYYAKHLWLWLTYEISFPLHRLVIYILCAVLTAIFIGTSLNLVLDLPLDTYGYLSKTVYFYGALTMICILVLAMLLVSLNYLAQSRARYERNKMIDNIVCEFKTSGYIQFLWLAILITPLTLMVANFVNPVWGQAANIVWMTIIFILLAFLYIVGGYRNKVDERLRFAPGTAENDELGYGQAAINDMKRIVQSDKHIIIANINGRMGEGKSSYLRMMINSCNQDNFLYTYISLTETNETKSFSKLFAERWSETLHSRYPSITNSAKGSILDNIFRESGNNLIYMVRAAFSTSRWPLRRTPAAMKGDNYPDEVFVPDTVASLFSYVPHFKEDYWVVVIDEIERARFDEIYRTVETIERFRIESQWGLPLKLVFILCTDRLGFRERANSMGPTHEPAQLAHSFFERELKTIDVHIDLPPIAPDKKQNFIINYERSLLIERYDINTSAIEHPDTKEPSALEVYWSMRIVEGTDFENGRLDDKKAHDLMLLLLMKESPRSIKKIIEETDRFLGIFKGEGRDPNQIRISDLIMLHYLKFKYPEAIRFLYDTHYKVFPEFHNKFKSGEIDRMLHEFSRENRDGKNEVTFKDFFEAETGHKVDENDENNLRNIRKVISIICYPVIEYIRSLNNKDARLKYEYEGKPNYDRTLGLPENMWDALTIATENIQDQSDYLTTQRDEIYIHQNKKLPPHLVRSGANLLASARNMRRFYPGDYIVSIYLAERIAKVLSTRRLIKRYPGTLYSDSPYKNLTYVFTFHLANYLDREDATDERIDTAFSQLKAVLTSKETMLEAKLTILNTLFIYSRSKRSGSIELDHARIKLEERYRTEINMLIKRVLSYGLNQYLPNKGRSIYDFEENYLYTLYQMWSGDPNDIEGISKIRKVASYGLINHRDAIDYYWNNSFSPTGKYTLNSELQLRVEDLIKVTEQAGLSRKYKDSIEYWNSQLKKGKRSITPASETDEFSTTVYMQLKRRGYLD